MNKNVQYIALVIALSEVALSAHAATYKFTALSGSNGYSTATAINASGQVVGQSGAVATLWNDTTATKLDMPLHQIESHAVAINASRQVVGWTFGGYLNATQWNGTAVTELDLLQGGWESSQAYAINASGQVAGSKATFKPFSISNPIHATLWNGANASTDLGTLSSRIESSSWATSINDSGQVAGYSDTDIAVQGRRGTIYLVHAALWDSKTNTKSDLGTLPGGTFSMANAINASGLVVGQSDRVATLWDSNNGTITELGVLPGKAGSWANAINAFGQVVGESATSYDDHRATLWDSNSGTITDLNSFLDSDSASAGWELTKASGINDNGWIVGEAINIQTGETHAYLLIPVPEPETYAMLLAGLGLFGAMVSCRKSMGRIENRLSFAFLHKPYLQFSRIRLSDVLHSRHV